MTCISWKIFLCKRRTSYVEVKLNFNWETIRYGRKLFGSIKLYRNERSGSEVQTFDFIGQRNKFSLCSGYNELLVLEIFLRVLSEHTILQTRYTIWSMMMFSLYNSIISHVECISYLGTCCATLIYMSPWIHQLYLVHGSFLYRFVPLTENRFVFSI